MSAKLDDLWYCAAPFFNGRQVSLCEDIEAVFKQNEVPLFTPRTESQRGTPDTKITPAIAKLIFTDNVRAIQTCGGGLLAVIDYTLQPRQKVVFHGQYDQMEIRLPDTGVLFEMGYAHALKIPVVLFTMRDPTKRKLNVMLSACARGVLFGIDALERFVSGGCDIENVPAYEGAYQ